MSQIKCPECARCGKQILHTPRLVERREVCGDCYKTYEALKHFFWAGGKPTMLEKKEIGIQ